MRKYNDGSFFFTFHFTFPLFFFTFAFMKLKFFINYHAEWGQQLCVALSYVSRDDTQRHQRLPMQTEDGLLWVVETSAVESRQHPLESICYHYQVEDQEGRVLRQEWTLVPRSFHFDTSKSYVFRDQWKDRPLNYHLYTDACRLTAGYKTCGNVKPLRLPLYRRTIMFRVSAPQLKQGQVLALVGSHPAIGAWSAARYLPMEYVGQGEWMLTVNVDAIPMPVEYKYVVVDEKSRELIAWEEGDNRVILENSMSDGMVTVAHGDQLRLAEQTWRAAGVVIPVFSLRSEHSYGVGDFGDLKRMVDWAVVTGMKMIQLLPVNDTTTDGHWHDSHPYNIVSAFALHPHYLDLEAVGVLKDKQRMTVYRRRKRELNALPQSDYEAVDRVKHDYIEELFAQQGDETIKTRDYQLWVEENNEWLEPYAKGSALVCFIQYHLHLQLKAAADYARQKGVVLKGDLPIGLSRKSTEVATHPDYFNLDCCAGTPPDSFNPMGNNWGFPTYNWESKEMMLWQQRRLQWFSQYFDALRIDHVLGFFRIWEIPAHAVYGQLGHFSPALPLTAEEIEYFGLSFRRELFTKPFINEQVLTRLFGVHANYVKENFLVQKSYGLYDMKGEYGTQQKVRAAFEGRNDENSRWICQGLYRLIANVLFLEDERQKDMYHPRIAVYQEPVYNALSAEEKDAFMRIYNNYYYERHNFFWGDGAIRKLSTLLGETKMLICAEDLGMLPACVSPVLDQLRILTLEVQSMPKQIGQEFAYLNSNPYRSVCTISTHDMSPLRLWWQESPERTQRYYVTMLQKEGRAPEQLPAHMAEEIIARHLYSPSMICLLSLQDWLSMDAELRAKNPKGERINVPSDPYNRWQWRMHLTIEQLLDASHFNNKVKTMLVRSKRC